MVPVPLFASSTIYALTESAGLRVHGLGPSGWESCGGTTVADVEVDTSSPGVAYRAGNGLFRANLGCEWQEILPSSETGFLSQVHVDPESSSRILASGSGLVWSSDDGGSTWTILDQQIPWVRSLAIDSSEDKTVYAGTDGRGVLVYTPGLFGDGFESGDVSAWIASVP